MITLKKYLGVIPVLFSFFSENNSMAQTVIPKSSDDGKVYVEGGLIYGRYSQPSGWFTSAIGNIKLGYQLNDNLAVEGMLANSISDTTFYVGSTQVNARVSNAYGIYVKPSIPLQSNFNIFARIGFTHATISANTYWGSGWASGTGLSYGAGAKYYPTDQAYIQLDYMSYYDKDGIQLTGPGMSLGINF